MARASLLDARTATFLELVGNGKIYRVPAYQRDYSWEEEQWDDLWNDLEELRGRSEERHYMGALVVEARNDREFSVIDGQQRLATISIFVLAAIDKLDRLAHAGTHPEENRERASGLRSRYVGEKDPASLLESSKLFLNATDNPFYQDYLVQLRPPLNPRGLPKSNRLLWDCFAYFRKRLDEIDAFNADGAAIATMVTETVGRQLLFILISVDDDLNAYTVFETLNARGLELSTTDLLKNYLFSRIKVPADLEALQRRWRALVSTVRQELFPEFLRYHLLCELPRIRGERLFKIVRERVRAPQQVFSLVDALERRAELFAALSDVNHAYWTEAPGSRAHVRELQLFRVRQVIPLIFAVWERFSREDVARVLKLLSVISFRYSVVSGLNPNHLESVYSSAARAVLEGTMTSPKQVFEHLSPIIVEDSKFEQDFAGLTVTTKGPGKRLAKYILGRLETDLSGRSIDSDTDSATIEHILPENPSAQWEPSFPRDQWDAAVYRVGNLTLLEPSLNRRIANDDYSVKLDLYRQSTYEVARALADGYPTEWTLPILNARQKEMARRAVHLWRPAFA